MTEKHQDDNDIFDLISTIQNDLRQIKDSLLGSQYGNPGIIKRVDLLEIGFSDQKKWKWYFLGATSSIALAVIGVIIKLSIG